MKERRSLFGMIFGKKQTEVTKTQLEMLNCSNAQFSTVSDNIYDSKVARECIDRIATHCAKLLPKHIQDNMGNPTTYFASQGTVPNVNNIVKLYNVQVYEENGGGHATTIGALADGRFYDLGIE